MEKETKEDRITRRHRERDAQMKASPGYVTFSIMFTLAYPFIAVFTFVMSAFLALFSGVSKAMAWVVSGGNSK
ncbi:hypothetical protein [Spirosoma fluminis]